MSLDESNRNSLELVLEEFFTPACDDDYDPVDISHHPEYADIGEYPETCQYWIHIRAEQDIITYKAFIGNKSAAGKASAKARKDKKNSSSTGVEQKTTGEQLTTNQEPLTSNHKPIDQKKGFRPPSQKEVEQYCYEKSYSLDAESFICFYESKGWMVGKNKMKNWKAALTNWQKRGNNNGTHKQTNKPSLAERLEANRKRSEQQTNEQPMGADGVYIRS